MIGEWAFFRCESIESIVIPFGVIEIETWAFGDCKALVSMTISKSVRVIQERIFGNCDKLSSIHFDGTLAEWNLIHKEDDWNKSYLNCEWSLNATVYCHDIQIVYSAE